MCKHSSQFSKSSAVAEAVIQAFQRVTVPAAEKTESSRRRRLWELPTETHCPVIGVCLPITTLRKLINKELGESIGAGDYEFHVSAVSECSARRPISERIQRELDRRYAASIRRLSQSKTTSALEASWEEATACGAGAEVLWATLTHPCCNESLRQQVCRDIHMFQHQAGASARADLSRLAALREENTALMAQLLQLRERFTSEVAQRDAEISELQTQLVHMRGRLSARAAQADHLHEQLIELRERIPHLPERMDLLHQLEEQKKTIRQLERQRLPAHAPFKKPAAPQPEKTSTAAPEKSAALRADTLRDKAVLCVGGRPAVVPMYRKLIECSGARFLHHDGGEEDASKQLDASLSAADLVICQTGCISHGAYWRVKDHCKRTGKQCVFVEKPSASSLARCLRTLEDEAPLASKTER